MKEFGVRLRERVVKRVGGAERWWFSLGRNGKEKGKMSFNTPTD